MKQLSPLQKEIVRLRADGVDPDEIAQRYGIARSTVLNHLLNAARRKGCRTTTDLMIYVWRKRMTKACENPRGGPL